LLSAPLNEYAAVKIVPTKVADAFGKIDHLSDEDVKERMQSSLVLCARNVGKIL